MSLASYPMVAIRKGKQAIFSQIPRIGLFLGGCGSTAGEFGPDFFNESPVTRNSIPTEFRETYGAGRQTQFKGELRSITVPDCYGSSQFPVARSNRHTERALSIRKSAGIHRSIIVPTGRPRLGTRPDTSRRSIVVKSSVR